MKDPVKDALEWYGEQASAMARYTLEVKPGAMEATATSMALDAGRRANEALAIHNDATKQFLGIILQGEPLRLPSSALEAEWMEKVGFAFLREHAPEKLTPEAMSRPIPDLEPEPRLPHAFHVIMALTNMCAAAARKGDMAHAGDISNLCAEIEKLFPEGKKAVDRIYPLNREGATE